VCNYHYRYQYKLYVCIKNRTTIINRTVAMFSNNVSLSCSLSRALQYLLAKCHLFNYERRKIKKREEQWPSARADTVARFSNFYQQLEITQAISYMAEQSRREFFITRG